MGWRVGNGEQISIWGDKWLLSPSPHLVRTPISVLQPNAKVSALIDTTSGWWNYPLIEAIFARDELEHIYSIPLSPLHQPDKVIWRGTTHGGFTVRRCLSLSSPMEAAVLEFYMVYGYHCPVKELHLEGQSRPVTYQGQFVPEAYYS
jgi:hypothetical protein